MQSVIITAGGIGLRMNNSIPKQFLLLYDKPIIVHSINAFYHYNKDIEIIVTIPKAFFTNWIEIKNTFCKNINIKETIGGENRFQSIKNALSIISKESTLVAIHDAVRPFVSQKMLNDSFLTAQNSISAIPIIKSTQSLKLFENNVFSSIDREKIYEVQTPQCFKTTKIIEAYNQNFSKKFTDDSSVFEKKFKKNGYYEGSYENIKITSPIDIEIAKAIFNHFLNNPSYPYLV